MIAMVALAPRKMEDTINLLILLSLFLKAPKGEIMIAMVALAPRKMEDTIIFLF